jgi:hypothetical protein
MCYDGGMQENTIEFGAGKYTMYVTVTYMDRILNHPFLILLHVLLCCPYSNKS